MILFSVFVFVTSFVGSHWLPTKDEAVDIVVNEVESRKSKVFYDLGSGDARLVLKVARKTRASATGIEIEPLKWLLSMIRIKLGGTRNARVLRQNFFKADLSGADIIYCYLPTSTMRKLEPKIRKLKKGTIVIAHCIKFPTLKPIKENSRLRLYVYKI